MSDTINVENLDKVGWMYVSRDGDLSEEFIEKHSNEVDWDYISAYQHLSEAFIEKHSNEVNWDYISAYQHLSEGFIEKYANKINWYFISMNQKLSEKFIERHLNEVNWDYISTYQHLSEAFIEKHSNEVNWYCISKYQHLSEEFIKKYANKVDLYYISKYQTISKSFAKKYSIPILNNSHSTIKEWKKMILNTNMYECHKDYFYAYKGIRSDRYSKFNFQYQYLPGETYECFSDYTTEENSFGLSAWTEEKAKIYCKELVVKVKIYYRDVTAIVHGNNKIRCKKLTVLN